MFGRLLFILLFSVMLTSYNVKKVVSDKIQWLTMQEAAKLQKENFKPIIVDLYTDWCHWCKVMDKETYENENVIKYLNEKFYCVKLNAETRDTINWQGKGYTYNAGYKVNTFSLYITDYQPSFPTTIFLTDDKNAPMAMPGFLKPKEIELMVKYVGEGAYKDQPFQVFQHNFHSTW
jgi:thioredoxin-related protein